MSEIVGSAMHIDKFRIGAFPEGSVVVFDNPWYNDPKCRRMVLVMCEPEIVMPNTFEIIQLSYKFDIIYTYNDTILANLPHKARRYVGLCATVPFAEDTSAKKFQISGWASLKGDRAGYALRREIYDKQCELTHICSTFFRSLNRNNSDEVLPEVRVNPFLGPELGIFPEYGGCGPNKGTGKCCLFDEFQYSIIIENSRQKNYFTEKIIDCLVTKTLPIYWGCPNIDEFFDTSGWIIFDSYADLKEKIESLTPDYYEKHRGTIEKNAIEAMKYDSIYKLF